MVNILLAENQNIVRDGIAMLLENHDNMRVVGAASTESGIFEMLEQHQVDIVLTDIYLQNIQSAKLLTEIRIKYPNIKIVILTTQEQEDFVVEAFRLGADGYLLKPITANEFVFALKFIADGGKYICATLGISLIDKLSIKHKRFASPVPSTLTFSDRELVVLQYIADGYTNLEIAEKLFLSKRTVEGHRQTLLEKTAAKNSAALVRYGVMHGLVH